MKKLVIAAVAFGMAVAAQAATIGWSIGGLNSSYAGNVYYEFVIGQASVASIAQITALLDAGSDFSSYVFGQGTVADNGSAVVSGANSGKSLGEGTYTSFAVLFDGDTATPNESKYVVLSGGANQTKTIAEMTASAVFAAGNVSSVVSDANNWKAYGTSVPEPTSGLLLLLGMAGMALKRKHA